MATKEAVERRRANRRCAAQVRSAAGSAPTRRVVVVEPSVVRTGLSDREQALLREATEPHFDSGQVQLRFMGVAFLELHHLGWTPAFLEHDLCVEHRTVDERREWAQEQFEIVWEWWTGWLTPATRADVIAESRFSKGV